MAPSKKKKKPAANPTRGFATTSSISKSKLSDVDKLDEESAAPAEATNTTIGQKQDVDSKQNDSNDRERELSELTPEQLEAQLEDSELQLFIEKYGSRCKKESARHVSRLETERRLFRGQAEYLRVNSWITEDIAQEILRHIAAQKLNNSSRTKIADISKEIIPASDEVVVKVWTLKRTLEGLGFLERSVWDAIGWLIENLQSIEGDATLSSKEGLWGLEQCLDYLAISCDVDNLPGYDSHQVPSKARHIQGATLSLNVLLNEGSSSAATTPGIATPTTNNSENEAPFRDITKSPIPLPDDVIESDDDLEPHELLDRFIQLKSRLHQLRPDLTEPAKAIRRKGQKVINGPSSKGIDSAAALLMRRIRALESDMLFDRDDANEKWADLRVQLVRNEAQEKKSNQKNHEASSPIDETTRSDIDVQPPIKEEDQGMDLSDFFSSLPEESTHATSDISSMAMTSSDGVAVVVRDFGKWAGLNPRRVFEEACKARDSSSRITYTRVSKSSFSCRHNLTVRWSRPQDLPDPISIKGVTCSANDKTTVVEMRAISTPDSMQSEGYVSTVALFFVFISSPKEEKAHLRLPSVWRDLWKEFSDARQVRLDTGDKDEIRDIRQLVESRQQHADRPITNKWVREADTNVHHSEELAITKSDQDPRDLSALWSTKISTPTYKHMLASRIHLPVWSFKEELLTVIENNQVTIVCGETGCGKSTQVPTFILENELSNGRDCKIYCTEPRRISAISLARRVSEELGEKKNDVGTSKSLIGYAIRLESQVTASTRLVYATTGIVMRMLERGTNLEEVSHILIDEVHERTIDSDFLLIVLRKLMARRPNLKVVLMSATVNSEQFSRYFNGAPIMNVPGRTFPVETKFLEDAIEATGFASSTQPSVEKNTEEDYGDYDPPDEAQQATASSELDGYSIRTRNALAQFNEYRINYELIIRLLETIATQPVYAEYSKAILVFLPGMAEIRRVNDMLVGHRLFARGWYVFPLHSTIATEEQERAFLLPPLGVRKIVLATNIAETGITIPDVTCVIDTGKHREMRFDERRQLSRLIETFISKANAKQRRGRAGRVQSGLCYHLFTRGRHDRLMAEQQTPEMLRLSLQDLALRVKICRLGAIDQILSEALNPPLPKNVRRAVDSLIDVKALTLGEELTPLGRQLAKLPLDVYLGKLIILASIFKCLDGGLSIAAILSSKSPFSAPMGSRSQADLARLAFKKGDSDLLTAYNAYCAWRRVCTTTGSSEFQFCRKNFLSSQTLSNIEDLKAQLTTSLLDAGYLVLDESDRSSLNRARFYSSKRHFVEVPASFNINGDSDLVLNSVIGWSFYPKLLSRDGKGWRNVSNNQIVNLHPTSVNKSGSHLPKWLSFYHIMQSTNKFYNAHETSPMEDFAVALIVGAADFKMYSGVIVLDANRIRFHVNDWKTMLIIKALRTQLREIMAQSFRSPGRELSAEQEQWFSIWHRIFAGFQAAGDKRSRRLSE